MNILINEKGKSLNGYAPIWKYGDTVHVVQCWAIACAIMCESQDMCVCNVCSLGTDPNNPSADCFQYHAQGRRVCCNTDLQNTDNLVYM